MSNIEKIRQEIDMYIKSFELNGGIYDSYEAGELNAYKNILAFIDSLPEEKQPEDLEEAAMEIVIKMHPCLKDCAILGDRLTRGQLMALVKAGAEWQYKNTITFLSEVMFQDMKKGICGWGEIPEKK